MPRSHLHGKDGGKAARQLLALCRNAPLAMPGSSRWCLPSAHLCLVFSPGPTRGWMGREKPSGRDRQLLFLLQTVRTVSQLCCRVMMTGMLQWKLGGEAQNPGEVCIWPMLKVSSALLYWRKGSSGLESDVCLVHAGKELFWRYDPQQGLEIIGFSSHHCHDSHVSPNNITSLGFSSFSVEWGI